jgi:hypothetical protein
VDGLARLMLVHGGPPHGWADYRSHLTSTRFG